MKIVNLIINFINIKYNLLYFNEKLKNIRKVVENIFNILIQNKMAKFALLDWRGLGTNKQKILDLLKSTSLEIIRL